MVSQDVIVGERRFQYEAEVNKNPLNYDSWFDYIRLEEAAGDYDKVREVCAPALRPCVVCSSETTVLGCAECASLCWTLCYAAKACSNVFSWPICRILGHC